MTYELRGNRWIPNSKHSNALVKKICKPLGFLGYFNKRFDRPDFEP